MRRLALLVVVLGALFVPTAAFGHDNGDGPNNNDPYIGTDCGGWYRSDFTHAFWYDCWVKDDVRPVYHGDTFSEFHVWGFYMHWREWNYDHSDWRYRYSFA